MLMALLALSIYANPQQTTGTRYVVSGFFAKKGLDLVLQLGVGAFAV
jgi:hypothetical protein